MSMSSVKDVGMSKPSFRTALSFLTKLHVSHKRVSNLRRNMIGLRNTIAVVGVQYQIKQLTMYIKPSDEQHLCKNNLRLSIVLS